MIILRSNASICSPSVQDLILKATTSTDTRSKPVGRGVQQTGSSGTTNHRSFNGKKVFSHHSSRGKATLHDGRHLEDAYWQKKPLQGRQVTSSDVLRAYGNDRTSLRAGFFLQKLCLQNILHGSEKVTPDRVIRELNRVPDRNNKHQLAIARFKEECCLRHLVLNGRQVTPDAVVKAFPDSVEGKLGMERFKEQCCLKGLALHGQQVTPDAVARAYQAIKAKLELARFKENCCLKGLLLDGKQVTAEAVVNEFPKSPEGKLGIARFKEQCCLRGLPLNGQQVTPDALVADFQAAGAMLELARFEEQCCLRGLLLHGQRVSPDEVVKRYQSARAVLAIARFKAECCLGGLPLNGQQITADAVVKAFPDSPEGKLGIARFRERCCLRGLALNGRKVMPDAVAKDLQATGATLELARFKGECCLRGLVLNGQQVTPEAVVRDYQATMATLELARFKAECCLRGLALHGRQVTTDAVVKDFQAAMATLALARFKQQCCLRGLTLRGQPVTPDEVVMGFPGSPEGRLGIARFRAECCLRGLVLNGQRVTAESVVKGYQNLRATLSLARFKAECCLRDLPLDGQKVTPDVVVEDYQAARSTLELARFRAECCLRGLLLHGQQVTPEAVVEDYQAAGAALEQVRFKEQCCLNRLLLNGRQVTPEVVVKDFERGGWLLERAIFYTQLALSARELGGRYLDNRDVLAAFEELPGDHSARQVRYLLQRLKQSRQYDETSEAQDILLAAWQILTNVSVKDDEQRGLRCILKFMAMQYELPIDNQQVSAELVFESIKILRNSFQNLRIHFFFLAHCCITGLAVDGRLIHRGQVLECLQGFPENSKLRHALGFWFAQCSYEANITDRVLFQWVNNAVPGYSGRPSGFSASGSQHEVFVANPDNQVNACRDEDGKAGKAPAPRFSTAQPLKPPAKAGEPAFPLCQGQRLTALTLKTLEIIQEINGSHTDPPILVTGSYARFLQNLCSLFNDIDIICTTEASASLLFHKLQALHTNSNSEVPKSIVIWPIPGCQAIKLPKAYNIQLKDGDLGIKAMALHISLDARVARGNTAPLAVHVPGVERLVRCLSFTEETRLLNDTLAYLADHLDPLTEQLCKGVPFDIPRTIIFNHPQNTGDRVYGLLMRSLLTLNKARDFIALHSERKPGRPGKSDHWISQLQEEQRRLHALTDNLQMKLNSHVYRHDFEQRVNDWLSTTQPVNHYQMKRKEFVKALLTMMHSKSDR